MKQDRCIDITAGELAFFEECNNNRLPFARMINSSRLAKKQASLWGHKCCDVASRRVSASGVGATTDMHRNDVHNENFKHDRNNGHTPNENENENGDRKSNSNQRQGVNERGRRRVKLERYGKK